MKEKEIGFAEDFKNFILSVIIFTSGEMLALPLITTITTIFAKKEKKSLYLGFQGLAEGLGWASAPVFGGIVLDNFIKNPISMWGIITIPGILTFLIFLKCVKINEKKFFK